MSIKETFITLNNFADNPYDAKYRPEKEMKGLYAFLLISLPILLGFCKGFIILAVGPLSIYWVITYFKATEYWKALGWKLWKYHLPTVFVAVLGIILASSGVLFDAIGFVFRDVLGFN